MTGARNERPWVHIAVDVSVRELDAKLLLATLLLRHGYYVSICRLRLLWNIAGLLPLGIYIDTRFNLPRRKVYERLKSIGHQIVAFDEEATNITNEKYYQQNSVREESLRLCEATLCWGDYHADVVRGGLPRGLQGIVASTGHPRFDILRAPYRELYREAATSIAKRYGRFFLVNSNSSKVVHDGKIEEYWRLVVDRGTIVDTPENRERFYAYHGYRIERHRNLVSMVIRMAQAFPDHKVIIRPKYNETLEQWRAWLPDGLSNVHIIHEGSAIPWLMASLAMLHSGCTTGTEAFLADVPVISYLREFRVGLDTEVPNKLSSRASTEDEVIDLLRQAAKGGLKAPVDERTRQEALADRHIAARTGPLASERIAARLQDIAFTRPDNASRFEGLVTSSERVGLVDGNVAWPEERGYRQSSRPRKSAGLSYEGIGHRLNRLFSIIPELQPIALTQKQSDIFLLTPADETELQKGSRLWSRLRSALQRPLGVA